MKALRSLHSRLLNVGARISHRLDGTAARRAELERFDQLSHEEQEPLAMAQFRRLLEHAFANVPYYADVAAQRQLRAGDFRAYADIRELPLLTKTIIREQGERLLSSDAGSRGAKKNHTGGSTGEPMTFYQDNQYRAYSQADKVRCYERCNFAIGQPLVFLWGSSHDSAAHKSAFQRFIDLAGRNLIWINTFDLSEQRFRECARSIVAHEPVFMVGYVAALTMYARFLKRSGLPAPRPRGIQASAEALTEEDRELLREVFGCEPFDRYGCREVGLIAHECDAHRGLHLSPLCNLAEFLDTKGEPVSPGETGRVVSTNLHNYAMPFIRYDQGDLATVSAEQCTCGRNTTLLSRIVGRLCDTIVCPGGRLIHGGFFNNLFFGRDEVKQFQVVQENETDLVVRLVLAEGTELGPLQDDLTGILHEHGDPALNVSFETLDHIATSASGKYRITISKLQRPFG